MEKESKRKKENHTLPIIPWDVLYLIFDNIYDEDYIINTKIRTLCKRTYAKYPRFENELFLETWDIFEKTWKEKVTATEFMNMYTTVYDMCKFDKMYSIFYINISKDFVTKKYDPILDSDDFLKKTAQIYHLIGFAFKQKPTQQKLPNFVKNKLFLL